MAFENQQIEGSSSFKGAKSVILGVNIEQYVGGFMVDLKTIPDMSVGIVPLATPARVDEDARTVQIHYAFRVYEDATSTATKIKLQKGTEGSRVTNGMALMVAPTSTTTQGKSVAVTAVDRTNEAYDEITVATLGVALKKGDILVEADKVDAAASMKVIPNGLTMWDLVKHPQAISMNVDVMFALTDGQIRESLIPPIAPAVKQAMADPNNGACFFNYTKV